MEEKTTNTDNSASSAESATKAQSSSAPVQERREAYGTAKTENLRDSGLWRVLLPTTVVISCLALFLIPLIILVPLLLNSIDGFSTGNATEAQLLWLWITMIVIEVGISVVIARGLLRVFLSQAGNYSHA
jgi:hypothetical protein